MLNGELNIVKVPGTEYRMPGGAGDEGMVVRGELFHFFVCQPRKKASKICHPDDPGSRGRMDLLAMEKKPAGSSSSRFAELLRMIILLYNPCISSFRKLKFGFCFEFGSGNLCLIWRFCACTQTFQIKSFEICHR